MVPQTSIPSAAYQVCEVVGGPDDVVVRWVSWYRLRTDQEQADHDRSARGWRTS